MRVINKINNNVAECIDGDGRHLIAFGRGIGFPKVPYELKNLEAITMTFYKLDTHFEKLLSEIPEELIAISAEIVEYAQKKLKGVLNPTLVFSLADHINFSLKRIQNGKDFNMYYSLEVAQLYPKENQLAEFTLDYLKRKIGIQLPKSEITSITMHFVNSQEEAAMSQKELMLNDMLDKIDVLLKQKLNLQIDRTEFNYNRFVTHIRYYIQRIQENEQFFDNNQSVFDHFATIGNPKVYEAASQIAKIISEEIGFENTKEEVLYLMIHVNRLLEQSRKEN